MELEKISIDKIRMYENNTKEHPEWQVEEIVKSISEFGYKDPIALDENNVIIEGHGRYLALKQLDYEEVEILRISDLTEKQKKAYAIVHNKLTMNTDFDIEKLQYELNKLELSGFNLELLGFEKMELDDIMEAETEMLELEEENEIEERRKHSLICPFCAKIGLKSEFKEVLGNGEDT
jgi:nuclease